MMLRAFERQNAGLKVLLIDAGPEQMPSGMTTGSGDMSGYQRVQLLVGPYASLQSDR